MAYYELAITAPDESRDAIINKMTEMGSTGFLEKDGKILAYFEGNADIAGVCDELSGFRDVLRSSGLDPAFPLNIPFCLRKTGMRTGRKASHLLISERTSR